MGTFLVVSSNSSSTSDYTILQSLGDDAKSLKLSSLSASWRKFIRSSTHQPAFVTDVTVFSVTNTTVAIPIVVDLSPEDRDAREKGLHLVARIEQLYHTDEEFRHWYQEGIDEIEAGHFVTFSEDGWQEE